MGVSYPALRMAIIYNGRLSADEMAAKTTQIAEKKGLLRWAYFEPTQVPYN